MSRSVMRAICLEDVAQIYDFCQRLKEEHARMSFTDVETEAEVEAWLEDPSIYAFGTFEASGVLTGLLRAKRGQGNKAHSVYLAAAVHPEYRKRNIAKELTLFALEILKGEGVKIARTYIYSWNKASIATIEKCGFTYGGSVVMHEYDPVTEAYIDDLIYHKVL